MFTRNFYAYYSRWLAYVDNDATTTTLLDGSFPYVLTNGGKWPAYGTKQPKYTYSVADYWRKCIAAPKFYAASPTTSSSSASTFNYGVLFGTGNTPPSIDDYTFSGDFVTGCVASYSDTRTIKDDQIGSTITVVYTITNNNDTSVTIGEVGMFHEVYGQTTSSEYTNMAIMTERTALETPVTIEPGGVGQVTYTLNFNFTAIA